jgi:putative tricarboxylic transport membrane protein
MIRGPRNFIVGLIFIGLALLFGISSLRLNLGTAGQMGPGYFPLVLSIALLLLGIAVVTIGLRKDGERPEGTNVRGVILVAIAVIVFAMGIRPIGLVPTVIASSLLFSLASREFRPLSSVVAALVLALGSWAVFIIGLRMPWAPFGSLFS